MTVSPVNITVHVRTVASLKDKDVVKSTCQYVIRIDYTCATKVQEMYKCVCENMYKKLVLEAQLSVSHQYFLCRLCTKPYSLKLKHEPLSSSLLPFGFFVIFHFKVLKIHNVKN